MEQTQMSWIVSSWRKRSRAIAWFAGEGLPLARPAGTLAAVSGSKAQIGNSLWGCHGSRVWDRPVVLAPQLPGSRSQVGFNPVLQSESLLPPALPPCSLHREWFRVLAWTFGRDRESMAQKEKLAMWPNSCLIHVFIRVKNQDLMSVCHWTISPLLTALNFEKKEA